MADEPDDLAKRLAREDNLAAARDAVRGGSVIGNATEAARAVGAGIKATGDKLGHAGDAVRNAASNPGATVTSAISGTARIVTHGIVAGVQAAVTGAAQGLDDTAGQSSTPPIQIEGTAVEVSSKPMSWIERKKAELDATIADLANTKVPLRTKAAWLGVNGALKYASWSTRTYPLALRPMRYIAHKMRDRLDKKIQKQGTATDWQKLRRRLLSIDRTHGPLANLRYAAINTVSLVSAAALVVGALDVAYEVGTIKDYPGMIITGKKPVGEHDDSFVIYAFSHEENRHAAEQRAHGHAVEIDEIGMRFNIEDSWLFGITNPQDIYSVTPQIGQCDFRGSGFLLRIPKIKLGFLTLKRPHILFSPKLIAAPTNCKTQLGRANEPPRVNLG